MAIIWNVIQLSFFEHPISRVSHREKEVQKTATASRVQGVFFYPNRFFEIFLAGDNSRRDFEKVKINYEER